MTGLLVLIVFGFPCLALAIFAWIAFSRATHVQSRISQVEDRLWQVERMLSQRALSPPQPSKTEELQAELDALETMVRSVRRDAEKP